MTDPRPTRTLTVHDLGAGRSLLTCRNGDRYVVDRSADALVALAENEDGAALDPADTELRNSLLQLPSDPELLGSSPDDHFPATARVLMWTGSLAEPLRERLAELFAAGRLGRVELDAGGDPPDGDEAVVSLHWYPFAEELVGLSERLAGRVWLPVLLRADCALLGPATVPGLAGSVLDAMVREQAAAPVPDLAPYDFIPPYAGRELTGAELVRVVGRAAAEAVALRGGGRTPVIGNQVRLGFADGAETVHSVLPLPAGIVLGENGTDPAPRDAVAPDAPPALPYRNDVHSGADLLVDARTGIVTGLAPMEFPPGSPAGIEGLLARAADYALVGPWPNGLVNGSVAIRGRAEAMRGAALGETVERYCGVMPVLAGSRWGSWHDLARAGVRALDPDELVLFTPERYERPGFPYTRFTRDLPVRWVRGRSATRDEEVWTPASMTWFNYHVGERATEPEVSPLIYAGIAAGRTVEEAACAGLEEILERHAVMTWWMHGRPMPAVEGPPVGPDETPRWSVLIENVFRLPVVGTIAHDEQAELAVIGFALRPTLAEAAAKAAGEAASNLMCAAELLDPGSAFWQGIEGGQDPGFHKPYRADRRYLDDFAPDFADVGDLEAQLQVHCDPRAVARALEILRPRGTADLSQVRQGHPRTLDSYRRIVEELGYEVIVTDITTPDVAAAGFHAARVFVPGLVSNFGAGFPLTGRGAIAHDGVALGWRDPADPLTDDQLNLLPIPHA